MRATCSLRPTGSRGFAKLGNIPEPARSCFRQWVHAGGWAGNSNPGTLLVSTDTTDWLDRSSPNIGVAFYAVAFGKGVFVAIDARGIGYTTQDGSHYGPFDRQFRLYFSELPLPKIYLLGLGDLLAAERKKSSPPANGVDWKARPILSTNSAALRAVAYGNGYFMAVGDKGLIVQSAPVASLRLGSVSGSGGGVSLDLDGEIGRAYRIESVLTCWIGHRSWPSRTRRKSCQSWIPKLIRR